ncbi:glucosamine-6-phosphate deaminase [Paenibacillus sp. NPDC058071]|uniref:glucosamine-6-phosphate deaminase n=1 Tax=Paenibacillus sp. NPDC058071 TaxID=3346326 RepID=UPI0036DF0A4A
MNISVFSSNKEVSARAAELIAELLREKPDAVLGLATGDTPIGVYEALVERFKRGEVSFRQASAFNLDEYAGLPPEHEQSYAAYMAKHLLNEIDLPLDRAYIPNGLAADLEAESKAYDRLLEQAGQLDLQLLGIGHNGHIGFNEPGPHLHAGTHVVALTEETRDANSRYFDHLEDVPSQAVTMGVGWMMKAKHVVLIARGEGKAAVVKEALFGPITTSCPGSLLQLHPRLTVLLDEGAARDVQGLPGVRYL